MGKSDFRQKVVRRILGAALLTPAVVPGGEPADCMAGNAATQLRINQCAAMDLNAADDELNRVYQAILTKYQQDREFLEKLRTAQRAWLKFRDADLEAKFPLENKQYRYGSMYPSCESRFLVERTRERIAHLRQWLDGAEEGEVCAGSVRYKPAPKTQDQ